MFCTGTGEGCLPRGDGVGIGRWKGVFELGVVWGEGLPLLLLPPRLTGVEMDGDGDDADRESGGLLAWSCSAPRPPLKLQPEGTMPGQPS